MKLLITTSIATLLLGRAKASRTRPDPRRRELNHHGKDPAAAAREKHDAMFRSSDGMVEPTNGARAGKPRASVNEPRRPRVSDNEPRRPRASVNEPLTSDVKHADHAERAKPTKPRSDFTHGEVINKPRISDVKYADHAERAKPTKPRSDVMHDERLFGSRTEEPTETETGFSEDFCDGPFDAGYGTCETYHPDFGVSESGYYNYGWCEWDCDTCGNCAIDACEECSETPTCEGTWDSGWGTCDTYSPGDASGNYAYCEYDCDLCGVCAEDACSQCDEEPNCDGPFDAGYGTCNTYAPGEFNFGWCDWDCNICGECASDACDECDEEPTCEGEWDSGWGTCDTYAPGGYNFGYCEWDCDLCGECAEDACAECDIEPECEGPFDAGYGTCETYHPDYGVSEAGYFNYGWCEWDCNWCGECAVDACEECSATPTCDGTWDAGWGGCETYSPNYIGGNYTNYGSCEWDCDLCGTCASDACTECSEMPVCDGPFDAGYGTCETYAPGGWNDGWCEWDCDLCGVCAIDACDECESEP